jgi:hypothetical protein
MSAGQIKKFFDTTFPNLVASKELADRLLEFQVKFITKNQEHMEFFGGNLTGVQVVRFTPGDMDRFFIDTLEIDEDEVREGLYELPVINRDHKVASDAFNNTCMYVIHLFLSDTRLNEKIRAQGAKACALILLYRYLTSQLFNGFKYAADPQIAVATYASLNKKFILKQLGSWNAVLDARTQDLVSPQGLHYKELLQYMDDKKILYAITDSQGRIRDIFKNIYNKFMEIHAKGERIKSSSSTFNFEGEEFLKDKTRGLQVYSQYINSIIEDKNSFIKQEIVQVLTGEDGIVHTAPPKLLTETLEWMSVNAKFTNQKEIKEFTDLTLVHSFGYLADNRTVVARSTDIIGLVIRLRGVYMSSRSTEVDLMKLRKLGEKIIKRATNTKNSSTIASVRTALMLYVVIRAFTMQHYAG